MWGGCLKPTASFSAVICTLFKRKNELLGCLESIVEQNIPPDEIIFVSKEYPNDELKDTIECLAKPSKKLKNKIKVRYIIQTGVGLTNARNSAIPHIETDIVFFLDDDVILDSNYFKTIIETYESDPNGEIVGVGGIPRVIKTEQASPIRQTVGKISKKLDVIFSIMPKSPYKITSAGWGGSAYLDVLGVIDKKIGVDVLSGSNMSFRRKIFTEFKFDEGIPGKFFGEDYMFTYAVSRKYKLILDPNAKVLHLESPINRFERTKEEIPTRIYFYKKYIKKNRVKFLISLCWYFSRELMLLFLTPSNNNFLNFKILARAYLAAMRKGKT